MSNLKQPVLVTGATSGLGQAIAGYLCAQGVRVYAGYRRPQDAERLKQRLGELATPLRIDISQACLPLLRQAGGRIVHIGSASGSFALPFVGAFAASKFATEAIADAMRRELRPFGIAVILIRPGRINTDIFDRAEAEAIEMVEHLPGEQRLRYEPVLRKFQSLVHRSAVKRQRPERVAAVVAHALHARRPRARYDIGIDAHFSKQVAKWAPDWLCDWVVARVIK